MQDDLKQGQHLASCAAESQPLSLPIWYVSFQQKHVSFYKEGLI